MTREQLSRRRVLYGSGVGIATVMAGCGGDGDGNGSNGSGNGSGSGDGGTTAGTPTPLEPNTNEVHVVTDYSSDAWQDQWNNTIIPAFEESFEAPIDVENVGMQGEGRTRLDTLLQSGNPPELFSGTITEIGDVIARGQATSVDTVVDELTEEHGSMPAGDTIRVDGEAYMVPNGMYIGGTLNYRQDIYDALELSVPETWDELIANVQAVHEAGGAYEDVNGWLPAAADAGKSGSDFSNWLYTAGGDTWSWANEDETRAELDFAEEDVTNALEQMDTLAEYSPDASGWSWQQTIRNWLGGNFAHCLMNNAWLNGEAYAAAQGASDEESRQGLMALAQYTGQAPVPKMEANLDLIDRGWALMDGWSMYEQADNLGGAQELMLTMYGTPEAQSRRNLVQPMRFLPPYEGVMEYDTYQSAEVFQALDGILLEKNRYCIEELGPITGGDRPSTVATLFAGRFETTSEMVNAVLVQDEDYSAAWDEAQSQLGRRLEEGQNIAY